MSGRDGAWTTDTAQLLEEIGFDSVWVPEHVVFFPEYTSQYPYGTLGRQEVEAIRGVYDPMSVICVLATVTRRMRLATYVCVIAQRNPILLAREVVVADHLSGGRFDLTVGVGWSAEEYEALGVPFERRGERTDEYLRVMKLLWSEAELTSFAGEFIHFEPLYAFPKPLQKPHPPIVVSGNSAATIRRIVEHGQGWAGYHLTLEEIERFLERLDSSLSAAGRSLAEIKLRIGLRAEDKTEEAWEADARYIAGCEKLGLHEVVVSPRMPTVGYEQMTRRYAEIIGISPEVPG
jgi:probable F420-dependent oxidoreductase